MIYKIAEMFGSVVTDVEKASSLKREVCLYIKSVGKDAHVVFDLNGVDGMTTKFAEELFGGILAKTGSQMFNETISFEGAGDLMTVIEMGMSDALARLVPCQEEKCCQITSKEAVGIIIEGIRKMHGSVIDRINLEIESALGRMETRASVVFHRSEIGENGLRTVCEYYRHYGFDARYVPENNSVWVCWCEFNVF